MPKGNEKKIIFFYFLKKNANETKGTMKHTNKLLFDVKAKLQCLLLRSDRTGIVGVAGCKVSRG